MAIKKTMFKSYLMQQKQKCFWQMFWTINSHTLWKTNTHKSITTNSFITTGTVCFNMSTKIHLHTLFLRRGWRHSCLATDSRPDSFALHSYHSVLSKHSFFAYLNCHCCYSQCVPHPACDPIDQSNSTFPGFGLNYDSLCLEQSSFGHHVEENELS